MIFRSRLMYMYYIIYFIKSIITCIHVLTYRLEHSYLSSCGSFIPHQNMCLQHLVYGPMSFLQEVHIEPSAVSIIGFFLCINASVEQDLLVMTDSPVSKDQLTTNEHLKVFFTRPICSV